MYSGWHGEKKCCLRSNFIENWIRLNLRAEIILNHPLIVDANAIGIGIENK